MTEVGRAGGARRLRLPLAVANDLAAAEDDFFAVARAVALDLAARGRCRRGGRDRPSVGP